MKLQREDIHPLQDTCPYFCMGRCAPAYESDTMKKRERTCTNRQLFSPRGLC